MKYTKYTKNQVLRRELSISQLEELCLSLFDYNEELIDSISSTAIIKRIVNDYQLHKASEILIEKGYAVSKAQAKRLWYQLQEEK